MNCILIIFFLVIIFIGVAYYFDYKNDKKYFSKSIRNLGLLLVTILVAYIFSELVQMILE